MDIALQIPKHADADRFPDLRREIHGLLGIPIDVLSFNDTIEAIRSAAATRKTLFISTENLNFLLTSRTDPEFRNSLLLSDLCTPDGMPVVWLARILGIPVPERVAGADLFQVLRTTRSGNPLSIYIFGGPEGVAASLCAKLGAEAGGLCCVGAHYPGFGDIESMSRDTILNDINSSGADLLAAALGAKKGQAWLLRNREGITVPVRVHLGASINFEAGTIERAPSALRRLGLEWLWRIKEEPHLWARYFWDGVGLVGLIILNVLPLLVMKLVDRLGGIKRPGGIEIKVEQATADDISVALIGQATTATVAQATDEFEAILARRKNVTINLAATRFLDTRFLGLLLMINKALTERGLRLRFRNVPPPIKRRIHLNRFGFLL